MSNCLVSGAAPYGFIGDDGCVRVGVTECSESARIIVAVGGGGLIWVTQADALVVQIVAKAECSSRTGQATQTVCIIVAVNRHTILTHFQA